MEGKFLIGRVFMLFMLCLLLLPLTMAAQQEPAECDVPIPPNAQIAPPVLNDYCGCPPGWAYDLSINSWDPVTHRSPDILVGYSWDELPQGVEPEDVDPRFFVHQDGGGTYFYTTLYARFFNNAFIACPDSPLQGEPKVTFSFADVSNENDPGTIDVDSLSWEDVGGTPGASVYVMKIPLNPDPGAITQGVLITGETHQQTYPVCWKRNPGDSFPIKFIIKAEVSWGCEALNSDSNVIDYTINNVAYSFYDLSSDLSLLKREAHIAVAIDLSGSMTENFDNVNKKVDVASEKAQLFVSLVEDAQYLGVYSFSTYNPNNDPFTTTYVGTDGLTSPIELRDTSEIFPIEQIPDTNGDDHRDEVALQIQNKVNDQTANGGTPVGQGLLRAKYGLDNVSFNPGPLPPSKAIVLFSDGLQNAPPLISTPQNANYSNPSYPNINAQQTFAANDITIYSIYFGPETGWGYALMNQVKDETGGDYVYGAATELELANVYYAIRGMVDDMVYQEQDGLVTVGESWPYFEVNFDNAVDSATVAITWPLGNGQTRLTIDRRQKGDLQWIVNNAPTTTSNAPHSFQVYRFEPGTNTTWEFQVRQISPTQGETNYAAAVFSNVGARINASLDDVGFEAGKPLPMYVDLHSGAHPLEEAKVTALVKVPARSFSSTLQKYFRKFTHPRNSNNDDTNQVAAILPQLKKFLKEDFGSEEIYVYRDVELELRDDGIAPDKKKGDGRYTALLTGDQTRVAGNYKVNFKAVGELLSGRMFERCTQLSTICNVGLPDKNRSAVEMSLSPLQPGTPQLVTITILPVDNYGNAAFPGSAHQIKVIAQKGSLKDGIVDNQDSSFTQLMELAKGEVDEVEVFVRGVSLGTFSTDKPLLRHELSLHGGNASPEGPFKKVVSAGRCIGIDYCYRLNHNFGIRWEFGLNWFNDRSEQSDKLVLAHFNAYLQYRYLTGRIIPYFETGGGYYKLEDSDSALGYAGGVGVQWILSKHWNIDFNVHAHYVGGDLNLNFIRVLAGFIFKF